MTNNCNNITHRSSLGLLPDNVLADLSNINPGETTFKIPFPRPIQSSADTSTLSPKNLSLKYLRPNDISRNDPVQPSSTSSGVVDDIIGSFAAKNTSLNEMSTREVDWTNLFERIGAQKDNPIVGTKNAPLNAKNNICTSKQDSRLLTPAFSPKVTDEKSFSIEALSISMANRPRSTSFGGSPHETRNELAYTRMEGFSDYTNPPGSNFGTITIDATKGNSKIKDISYLEDSLFTENPLTARMDSNKNSQYSLGPFPPQSEFSLVEFEANSFVSNNHLEFINQAEKEFIKEHRFDQFDITNGKEASKTNNGREFFTNSVLTINDDIQEDDDKEQANKLSASAYFAMSTSRLGSLERAPETDTSSPSANLVNGNDLEGRPNLGFSRIVSPKRKPVSVISMENEDKSFNPKASLDPKQLQYPSNDLTTSSNVPKFSNSRDSQRSSLVTDLTFKIPQPPNMDNKKDTQTLPQARRSTTRSRHSSPIKRDQDQVKENIAPPAKEKNTQLQFSFPVEIDKVRLSWLAVGVNQKEEKRVCLQNITDREIHLRLILRGSSKFTFKQTISGAYKAYGSNSTHPTTDPYIDTVLQRNEAKDVTILFFTPLSCSSRQIKGTLVIKPRGIAGSNKASNIKASIPLYAYVGSPKVEFDDSFKANVGHFSNQFTTFIGTLSSNTVATKEVLVYNRGDGSAFVRIQTFADMDYRVECGNEIRDPIRVEPNAFILNPGCTRNITIFVNPSYGTVEGQPTVVGSMLIISGPEICRQAVCSKKMLASNKSTGKRYLVSGVDFDVPFQGESNSITAFRMLEESLIGDEESVFETKMTTSAVNIVGLIKSKSQFVKLQIEDTMSESRINCTVLGGSTFEPTGDATRPPVRNYDTIKEEEEIQIPPKSNCYSSHKSDKVGSSNNRMANTATKKSPFKNSEMDLFKLRSTKLFFPPVKVGNTCVEKLIVENRSHKDVQFAIESISAPFKTNSIKFEVKPKSYLKVPIVYSPEDAGKHKGNVLLKTECGRQLDAALIGDSMKSDTRSK